MNLTPTSMSTLRDVRWDDTWLIGAAWLGAVLPIVSWYAMIPIADTLGVVGDTAALAIMFVVAATGVWVFGWQSPLSPAQLALAAGGTALAVSVILNGLMALQIELYWAPIAVFYLTGTVAIGIGALLYWLQTEGFDGGRQLDVAR